jgi:fumarate reductase subunit D
MVLHLFEHDGDVPLDFVYFDGLLGLLLVEGLQQVHHDLPHLRLHLVPLELLYFYGLFLFSGHLILFMNVI